MGLSNQRTGKGQYICDRRYDDGGFSWIVCVGMNNPSSESSHHI